MTNDLSTQEKLFEVEIDYIPTKSKSINKSYSYDDLMHALAYGHRYGKNGLTHDLTIKDYKECMNFKN